MSSGAQSLYFHLCLDADDDGVVEAFTVMRLVKAMEDDFRVLIAKDFIRPLNEELVSFIIDWNEHNLIRADRKVNSIYKDLLVNIVSGINIKEPKPRADTGVIPRQLQTGRPVDGIGKDRLDKDRIKREMDSPSANGPFSVKEYIQSLKENPRRDLQLIGRYLEKRRTDFSTKEQIQVAIRRHLRSAKQLEKFSDEQIKKAVVRAEEKYNDVGWTLDTLLKILTSNL